MTTGLGGGILRDILVNEVPLLLQGGEMVAIPAFAGAALTVAIDEAGRSQDWALVLGVAVAFGLGRRHVAELVRAEGPLMMRGDSSPTVATAMTPALRCAGYWAQGGATR